MSSFVESTASAKLVSVDVNDINDSPTLTNFADAVDSTNEDTEVELNFSELTAQGDENDVDGTVNAFIVQEVTSGTLKIGTSSESSLLFASGSNDIIDSTNVIRVEMNSDDDSYEFSHKPPY